MYRFKNESTGKTWAARVIRKGDRYGLDDCLIHDKPNSMVEFYDTNNGEQFVSRYYTKTIMDIANGAGLLMDGGTPQWSLDGGSVAIVKEWLKQKA